MLGWAASFAAGLAQRSPWRASSRRPFPQARVMTTPSWGPSGVAVLAVFHFPHPPGSRSRGGHAGPGAAWRGPARRRPPGLFAPLLERRVSSSMSCCASQASSITFARPFAWDHRVIPRRHDFAGLPLGRVPGGGDVMVKALEHDQRCPAILQDRAIGVGAGQMDPQVPSFEATDREGTDPYWRPVPRAPSRAQHALFDQRVQFRRCSFR